MEKIKRTVRSGFNPLDKFVVVNTIEGYPKYEPKTLNGLPLYDKEDRMIMVPVLKIKPEAMIEWLYTEYPNAQTEFVRHTEKPFEKMDGGIFYPPEVIECKLWLEGKRGECDTSAFASRENIPGEEFNPIAAAQTSALIKAMKNLGFGCDVKIEEVYKYLGLEDVCTVGKMADFNVITKEINDNIKVEAGRNGEICDNDLIEQIVEKAKASLRKTKEDNAAEEKSEEKEEIIEEPKKIKKKRGRPRKNPVESTEDDPKTSNTKFSAESEETDESKSIEKEEQIDMDSFEDANIFDDPDLKDIGNVKLITEADAPETIKRHEGETLSQIYKENVGLLKVIGSPTYPYQNKIPEDIHLMAKKIMEVSKK